MIPSTGHEDERPTEPPPPDEPPIEWQELEPVSRALFVGWPGIDRNLVPGLLRPATLRDLREAARAQGYRLVRETETDPA